MSNEHDRVAIVTGAAGGVGAATVSTLVQRGFQVVAEDISPSVADLASDDVATLVADVAESDSAHRAVSLALERFGRLDALVNNAARYVSLPFAEITDEIWDSTMRTNVRGAFVHSRAALPQLLKTKGVIVNVASISGLGGAAREGVYAPSKGALVQLTRQLAVELGPSGVRVLAVAPGIINTSFAAAATAGVEGIQDFLDWFIPLHPQNRMTEPQEVANVIAFLASDEASAMTGAIVPVDGGYTAR